MTVTFDSSAWIEYFSGSELGKIVKNHIDSDETIYTSAVSILEIKNKYQRENRKWKNQIEFITERSLIIDVDVNISLSGSDMRYKHGLHTIDAIIYASALSARSKLLTKDPDFKKLKNVIILE